MGNTSIRAKRIIQPYPSSNGIPSSPTITRISLQPLYDTDDLNIGKYSSDDYTKLSLIVNDTHNHNNSNNLSVLPDVHELHSSHNDAQLYSVQPITAVHDNVDIRSLRKSRFQHNNNSSNSPVSSNNDSPKLSRTNCSLNSPHRPITNKRPSLSPGQVHRINKLQLNSTVPLRSNTVIVQARHDSIDESCTTIQPQTPVHQSSSTPQLSQSQPLELHRSSNSSQCTSPQRGSISQLKQLRTGSSFTSRSQSTTVPPKNNQRTITDRPVLTQLSIQWRTDVNNDPLLYVSPEFAGLHRSASHVWYRYCDLNDIIMSDESLYNLSVDVLKLYVRELTNYLSKHHKYNTLQIESLIQKHLLRIMNSYNYDECHDYLAQCFRISLDLDGNRVIERYEFIDTWQCAITGLFDTIKQCRTIPCNIM